jgi:hypothetical protein
MPGIHAAYSVFLAQIGLYCATYGFVAGSIPVAPEGLFLFFEKRQLFLCPGGRAGNARKEGRYPEAGGAIFSLAVDT